MQATNLKTNHLSAPLGTGQRGLQLKLNPKDLIKEVHAEVCRLFEA